MNNGKLYGNNSPNELENKFILDASVIEILIFKYFIKSVYHIEINYYKLQNFINTHALVTECSMQYERNSGANGGRI